ncbi:MAG: hypothetical protein HYT70_00505 [Candidatus Aenigmarchaeota archaeon]|nr:hypothetical protein [Candidatus Aenigmarchaeota archaeon]
MIRDLLISFLDGFLAYLAYFVLSGNLFGINVVSLIPLPMVASSAIVLGVLVLVIDYVVRNVIRM